MNDEEIHQLVDEILAQSKERNEMNEIIEDMVEIVDENGKPTGQFRPRTPAQAEGAVIAENHVDHVI